MKQMYPKSKSSTSHKALYKLYIYTVYNFWLFPFPSFFPAFDTSFLGDSPLPRLITGGFFAFLG